MHIITSRGTPKPLVHLRLSPKHFFLPYELEMAVFLDIYCRFRRLIILVRSLLFVLWYILDSDCCLGFWVCISLFISIFDHSSTFFFFFIVFRAPVTDYNKSLVFYPKC